MPTLNVHDLPARVAAEDLAGRTAIVVDLLRASTTICQALAAGAVAVVPFAELDAVRQAAEGASREDTLLGGERHGLRIDGFDLGNSPAEYPPAVVAGRRILFTTTNGARALAHARFAERIVVGAAVNRLAVARVVAADPAVEILCAGTDGAVTEEDVLGAGCLAEALLEMRSWTLNAGAEAAVRAWRAVGAAAAARGVSVSAHFAAELRRTRGGANLLAIGQEADLTWCAQVDALTTVPVWDRRRRELRSHG
jgi:2-phosphosulfolactate phosphatase